MGIKPNALCAMIVLALGATQASAQSMDHSQMQGMDHSQMAMPMQHKAAPKQHPAKKKGATKPAAATSNEMDHSQMHGMDHSGMEGMDHSQMQGMDHSQMQGMDHGVHQKPSAPVEPITPIPVVTDADRAAAVPHGGHAMGDNAIHSYMLINRLEAWDNKPRTGMAWEGKGWIGTDLNRVWLRTEGERVGNHTEAANAEVLYGHSITPWWDVVGGVRQDFKPGTSQTFAAIGVQGLAPQKFEVSAMLYAGQHGQTAARFEAEYELLLTNRLILQPLVEVNAFGKDDRTRGIGSGLSTAEAGLRLRYEITRRFAPYIGVTREQAFGRTADFRRQADERTGQTRVVAGFRAWF